MASIVEKIRLICCDATNNNNKLWEGYLYNNDDVETRWGRVRDSMNLQSKMFPKMGKHFFDKKKREKFDKGYTEVRTVDNTDTKNTIVPNADLHALAKKQIVTTGSPELLKLIDRLVRANVHRITSSTQIKYNQTTGLFSTPLGIVTLDAIGDARNILVEINDNLRKEAKLRELVSNYLRLIPHDIGVKFNVKNIFPDDSAIKRENDILDSLESSYNALRTNPVKTSTTTVTKEEQVFSAKLDILSDQDREYKRLERWFENSKKSMHHYDRIKILNIFKIEIDDNIKSFKDIGNIQEVFHGTSIANCLSIIKGGLKISPPATAAIAGKMFGNGIYGSQTSSKSLGYTFGRWGQGGADMGYLYICDFAMGNAYYPNTYGFNRLPSGYDSCWALPKNTGLHNDELIIYKENQFKIKYLLEVK